MIVETYKVKTIVCTCLIACPDGYFGDDCLAKCNSTCTGCNKADGVCDRGCHPGWKGSYCEGSTNYFIIYLSLKKQESYFINI